jgi:hypothetical protein
MESRYVLDEARFFHELEIDRRAYQAMAEEIKQKYADKYVVIAHGKLIAVTEDFDQAGAIVDRLEPRPEHYLIFPGSEEPAFEFVQDNGGTYLEPA